MGIIQQAKDLYANKWVQDVILFYTIVSAISSAVVAVIAYSTFHAATTEFNDVISNWETPPITNFYFSSTGECETDFMVLKTPSWLGTTADACACASGAYSTNEGSFQYSSSSVVCDVNQTDAGCVSQPSISEVKLDEWRRSTVCYKQEGAAQLMSSTTERPAATGSGVCAAGYTACGGGSTTGDRTTCMASTQTTCPLTAVNATVGVVLNAPSSVYAASRKTLDGNASWWYADASATSGLMPIAEIKLALYDPDGKRGECFQDDTKQHKYAGKGGSYDYANDYPSECGRVDKRWQLLDAQPEADFLWRNFQQESACDAGGETADYLSTGTRCDGGAGTYFTDTDCQVEGTSSTSSSFGTAGCGASDTVCKNILYQSNCGALKRWASQGTKHWAVLVRREIYWQPTCFVSMVDVKAIQSPVNDATPTLLSNMIINIIVNLVIGIVFPAMYLINAHYGDVSCIPGEGEVEKKLLDTNKKYLNLLFHVAKIIPAAMAISTFATISSTLSNAAASGCEDDNDVRTRQTFETMSDQVATSNAAVTAQVCMDVASIGVAAVMALIEHGLLHALSARAARADADAADADAPDKAARAVELAGPTPNKGTGRTGSYQAALRAAELQAFLEARKLGHLFAGLRALGVDSLHDYKDPALVGAAVLKAKLDATGDDVAAWEASLAEVAAAMRVDAHLVLHEEHGTKSALLEQEMRSFLEDHGLGAYADKFVEFGIDELAEFKDEVLVNEPMLRGHVGMDDDAVAAYFACLGDIDGAMQVENTDLV